MGVGSSLSCSFVGRAFSGKPTLPRATSRLWVELKHDACRVGGHGDRASFSPRPDVRGNPASRRLAPAGTRGAPGGSGGCECPDSRARSPIAPHAGGDAARGGRSTVDRDGAARRDPRGGPLARVAWSLASCGAAPKERPPPLPRPQPLCVRRSHLRPPRRALRPPPTHPHQTSSAMPSRASGPSSRRPSSRKRPPPMLLGASGDRRRGAVSLRDAGVQRGGHRVWAVRGRGDARPGDVHRPRSPRGSRADSRCDSALHLQLPEADLAGHLAAERC